METVTRAGRTGSVRPDPGQAGPIPADRSTPGELVGVIGGSGGCGASTAATALAVTAAGLGRRVVLVDLDSSGRCLGRALGLDDSDGIRWAGLAGITEPLPGGTIRSRLARTGELCLLTGPWGSSPISAPVRRLVLSACLADFELVVLDLPRYELGSIPMADLDLLIAVSTSEVRSVLGAAELLAARVGPQGILLLRSDVGAVPLPEVRAQVDARIERFPRCRALAGAADLGALGQVVRRGSLRRMSLRLLGGTAGPAAEPRHR